MSVPLYKLYSTDIVSDTKPTVIIYTVTIYDSELADDVNNDMQLANDGFLLKYDGDEDDVLSPILPSSLKLAFVVQNNIDKSFVESLAEYQESRFFIDIKRKVGFGGVVEEFWKGVIAQDLIQYEDTRGTYPYTVEINAIDGLTRLKNYEGEIELSAAEDADVNEWFIKLLKKATTTVLYDSGETFFAHNINWFDQTMPASADGKSPIDPLRFTRVFKERLLFEPGPDYDELINWYDILQRLCRSYGARIIHAKGRFNLIQVEGYDVQKLTTDGFNLYSYEYESPTLPNMLDSIGVVGYNNIENIRLPYQLDLTTEGNRYNLLPMFANVRIDYNSDKPAYLVTPITRDWKIQKCSRYVVPVNGVVAYTYDFKVGGTGAWKVDILYYIEATDIVAPNTKYYLAQDFTWSQITTSVYRVTRTGFTTGNQVFMTSTGSWPLMPANCTVCVRIATQVQYGMNQAPVETTFTATVKGSQNQIVYIHDLPAYENSSLQYVLENPIYKDINDLAIVPDHNIRTFGGYWGKFIAWVRDTPTNTNGVPYPEFIGQAIVNLFNDVSRKKYYGDIWASWIPMQSIPYDGSIFIVNRAELKPDTGYWDVTMLEVRDTSANQGTRPWTPRVRYGKQGKQISDAISEVGETRVSYQGEFNENDFYLKNDMVSSNGLLAIARKPTNQVPSKDVIVEPETFPLAPLTNSSSLVATIRTGNRYIITNEGLLDEFKIFVPVASDGIVRYTLVVKNVTTGEQFGLSDFIVGSAAWAVITNKTMEVGDNSIVEALLFSTNSNTETITTFVTEIGELNSANLPNDGTWNTNPFNNTLRISVFDSSDNNISVALSTVIAGSTIIFQDPNNLLSYYVFFIMSAGVLNANVYSFEACIVNSGEDMSIGTASNCYVEVPTNMLMQYNYEAEHLINNQPNFALVEGIFNDTTNLNAYGVSIKYTREIVYTDWSIVADNSQEVPDITTLDTTRSYFLADAELTGLLHSATNPGVINELVINVSANDNQKVFSTARHFSVPQLTSVNIPVGNVQGQIEVAVQDAQANERIFVEVYLANTAGVAVTSGNGLPVGVEGVSPIVYLESELKDMPVDIIQYVFIKGNIQSVVTVAQGQRLLYRTAFQKVGTAGGAKQFNWYVGKTKESYIQLKFPIKASSVDYNNTESNLVAINVQQAIDELNENDSILRRRYNNIVNLPTGTYVVNDSWDNRIVLSAGTRNLTFTAGTMQVGTCFHIFLNGGTCTFVFNELIIPPYPNGSNFVLNVSGQWAEAIWIGNAWLIKLQ